MTKCRTWRHLSLIFFIKSNGWNNSLFLFLLLLVEPIALLFTKDLHQYEMCIYYHVEQVQRCENFDFIDITNGTYQFSIGGHIFPQIALNGTNNKAAILQELRKCQAQLYDEINVIEYKYSCIWRYRCSL